MHYIYSFLSKLHDRFTYCPFLIITIEYYIITIFGRMYAAFMETRGSNIPFPFRDDVFQFFSNVSANRHLAILQIIFSLSYCLFVNIWKSISIRCQQFLYLPISYYFHLFCKYKRNFNSFETTKLPFSPDFLRRMSQLPTQYYNNFFSDMSFTQIALQLT